MKMYAIWSNVEEEFFSMTESKRVANTYLGDPKWSVWLIDGRRGNQFIARFNHWKHWMVNKGLKPIYVTEVKEKPIKRKRSAEHNEAISRALSGKSKDPSHCQAISEAMMGNTNRS